MIHSLFGDATEDRLFAEIEAACERQQWRPALDGSLELLRRRLTRRGDFTAADRVLLERTADLAVLFGEDRAAESLLAALAADCTRQGLHFAAEYATLKRIQLTLVGGRYPEGRTLLESLEGRIGPLTDVPCEPTGLPEWEARCQWPGPREPDRALFFSRLYLAMGQWLAGNGQYCHAELLLQRGAEHATPPSSALACRAWVPLRLALAGALLEHGRLDDCGRVLQPLCDCFAAAEHPGWHVQRLELCGQRHLLRGEFGAAVRCFTEVVEVCTRGGFVRPALAARLNLAEVLISLNETAVARELLAEATVLAEAVADSSAAERIEWLYQLAHARAESSLAAAAPTVTELWHQRDGVEQPDPTPPATAPPRERLQPPGFLAFFDERALAVLWRLDRREVAAACERLAQVQKTFGNGLTDSELIAARLRALEGIVAYAAGEYPQSEAIFEEVCPELERLGLKPDWLQAVRFLGWCAVRLGRPQDRQRVLQSRVQSLSQELADSMPPAERAIWLLNKWTDDELAWAGEIEDLLREREATVAVPGCRLWQRLHEFLVRVDAARRTLVRRELGGADPNLTRPRTLRERLEQHPQESATLSFLVLPDRLLVVRSSWLSLDFAVSHLGRGRLRELVAEWHRGAPDKLVPPDEVVRELTGGLLLDHLLAPLSARVDRLTVVPDDALHGLPFAALPLGEQYLGERFALTLGHGDGPPDHPVGVRKGRAVTVGVSRGVEGLLKPLPNAPVEAAVVREILEQRGMDVVLLFDDDADRERVLREWVEARLVHAACHGIFVPNRPAASGVVLVPGPGRVEVVSLNDLARLDLRGLRHVTLSSCWGADNFVVPGRWIISLPQTLCWQGTESVLACLWRVDDKVGQAFCERFYKHLATMPRDQALQATQRDCLQNALIRDPLTSNPYYWTGYVLHGSADRLEF